MLWLVSFKRSISKDFLHFSALPDAVDFIIPKYPDLIIFGQSKTEDKNKRNIFLDFNLFPNQQPVNLQKKIFDKFYPIAY